MRRPLIAVLTLSILATGCLSPGGGGGRRGGGAPAQQSQVEVRNFQTRTYATNDSKLVLKAVVNVLQDVGFIIKTAETDLGVVTAERWADILHTKKALKQARKQERALAKTVVTECSANVTPHGNECRVRLTFQQRQLSASGAVMAALPVQDARFYQDFFAKVDKGVFLQKEGV